VYKAIHGLAPCYLNEMCNPVSTVPYLSALRSAAHGDLVVPRTRLQLGNRAFCVAGPVAWNSLPLHIRSAPALSTFRNMLKTHLFFRSYFTDCFQSTSSEHCTAPSSHVNAPYKLSFYYYYYLYCTVTKKATPQSPYLTPKYSPTYLTVHLIQTAADNIFIWPTQWDHSAV